MGASPPRLAHLLLSLILPAAFRKQVLGDALEGFAYRRQRDGDRAARRWYWRQLFTPDLIHLRREARTRTRQPPRQRNAPMGLDGLWKDLGYALRGLRKSPLFSATVLATLALGIGANTAMFTAVNAILLQPLPYTDADELVMVFRTVPRFDFDRSVASYPDFADWREQSTSLADAAAYGFSQTNYFSDDGAEQWTGQRITANLFTLIGTEPTIGRGFTAEEDRPGGDPVMVLSHGLWQSRFGSDPGIVGTTLRFDGVERTVVGVMPAGFDFPSADTEYWVPLQGSPSMERDTNFLQVIGRLQPDLTVADAQYEIEALAVSIDATAPGANQGYGLFVESRHGFVVRNARQALWVMTGAVALVLLLTCANTANLMLVRGAARRREIAVRAALGAGRGRLLRLLLTESLAIGVLGAVLGIGFARVLIDLALSLDPGQIPRAAEITLDPTVLAFSLGVAVLCALFFGAVPAWAGGIADPAGGMKHDAGRMSPGGRRMQQGFVALQVALALILLVGAGLLTSSFARLTTVDLGFEPEGVLAARVALPELPRPEMDMSGDGEMLPPAGWTAPRDGFVRSLLDEVAAPASVQAVAASYTLPLGRSGFSRIILPEGGEMAEDEAPAIDGNIVFGDYFAALGIPLVNGRLFGSEDRLENPWVVIVNQALADSFWPDGDAVGKRVQLGSSTAPFVTVVGVVGNVRGAAVDAAPEPRYYRALEQVSWPDSMFVVMKSTANPEDTIADLRRIVARENARLPLTNVTTASGLVEAGVAAPRLRAVAVAVFGALATALALVGVYGVVSFVVGERRREIGVRMAIGAEGSRLVRMVVRGQLVPVALGIVAGIAGAVGASRFLEGLLYEVEVVDPATYAAVLVGLLVVVAIACYVPARRAARVPPAEVLRAE